MSPRADILGLMIRILAVCTGNICRSPLAEVVLRSRLSDAIADITSAGTQGLLEVAMTDPAQRLAVAAGVDPALPAAHRSRPLAESMLTDVDVVLAMTRDHRAEVVSLVPSTLRRTFTVRELARLSSARSDDQLRADALGDTASERMRNVLAALARSRAIVRPASTRDDDVIDPFRQAWPVYEKSAAQLLPALDQVERVVRIVSEPA